MCLYQCGTWAHFLHVQRNSLSLSSQSAFQLPRGCCLLGVSQAPQVSILTRNTYSSPNMLLLPSLLASLPPLLPFFLPPSSLCLEQPPHFQKPMVLPPRNLIIALPRLLYKFGILKVVSHQWFYKLKGKFILKTLFCIFFVFLCRFYFNIKFFAFL